MDLLKQPVVGAFLRWPRLRLADLRKVASVRLQAAGLPASAAQKLLWHRSILTTLRHYSAADPATRKTVAATPLLHVRTADGRRRKVKHPRRR